MFQKHETKLLFCSFIVTCKIPNNAEDKKDYDLHFVIPHLFTVAQFESDHTNLMPSLIFLLTTYLLRKLSIYYKL